MGFYGNITNTSNTTFSFDRIYPNRLAMDTNANNDGIFIGRYVLVEYQEKAAYPVAYHATLVSGSNAQYYFYSSTNQEEISKIKYLGPAPDEPEHLPSVDDVNAIYQDGFYEGEILQYYIYSSEKKDWIFSEDFYKCIGGIDGYAIFEKIETPEMKSDYIQNFEIDENHYGQESKGFKGYDSTVWVKSSVEQNGKLITKYVNIADLNSVVPTFDIAADAPTMTPIAPHFDADSTNVYYKLHAQPQWGFRIAQTSADKSDEKTQWVKDFYDPITDTSSKKYASGVSNEIPNWDSDIPVDLNAAIYFNEAGFKKQLIGTDERNGEIKKHSKTVTENAIKIEATGKSGNEYNTHNGKEGPTKTQQIDTQEITINLPAIGNMMSDAWDIIHGPNRDDARTDNNGSLQGRLDSFEAFYDNQIPVKQIGGTIIGSKINGAANYDNNATWTEESPKPQDILDDKTSPNFERDDAWIKTEILTTGLQNGDKNSTSDQKSNSGISIHHTFHATASSTSAVDKNEIEDNIIKSDTYKEDKILSNNLSNIGDKKDFIELYTPYVDAKGHVVGKNIETITLPYGYKYFKTSGIVSEDKKGDLYSTNVNTNGIQETKPTKVESDTEAHNTQDTLSINPANKWIQTKLADTENDGDVLTIAHEIHSIDETVSEQGDNETSHSNLNKENGANNEVNLTMYDWTYDEAGHITSKREHTYTLPFSYKNIEIANDGSTSSAEPVSEVGTQTADATQDDLKLTTSNKWILLDAGEEDIVKFGHLVNDTPYFEGTYRANTNGVEKNIIETEGQRPKFGEPFNILNVSVDRAGHILDFGINTVTIPQGKYEKDTQNTNSTSLIVGMGLDGPTGEITTTSATTNTLQLSNYTYIGNGTEDTQKVANGQSINTALGTLEKRINDLDYTDPDANTTQFVSKVTEKEGVISVERANVGELVLTGYTASGKGNGEVGATDTVNLAFAKIENKINTFLKAADTSTNAIDTLRELQSYITTHGTEANNMLNAINTLDIRINKLNSSVNATSGKYISSIKIENDILSIGETELPIYTLTTGDNNGQVKFNNTNINVKGLGSAAYTESSAYLDATYAAKIDALEKRIKELEAKINPDPETPVDGE